MWNRRSRRRGAAKSSQLLYYLTIGGLVIAAAGVLTVSVFPSLAFSAVALDRPGTVGVANDATGVVGLDIPSSIQTDSQERLVTVTNNLDDPADITVSLDDGSQGTLYYGGSAVGDSHTVSSVAPGDSVQFDVKGTITTDDWQSSDCSQVQESAQTNGWEVRFYCASYDSDDGETTYKYAVVPVGTPSNMKDLSHVVFGFEDGFDPDVESTSPDAADEGDDDDEDDEGDVKTDPPTGVYGLKFDDQVSKTGQGQTYTFTIEGDSTPSTQDHGLKLGPNSPIVNLPGPSASGSSGGESLGFTVTSASVELTGTLERSTTLEPASTPTDAPADDGDGEEEEEEEEEEEDDEGGPPGQGGPPGDDDEDEDEEEDEDE